MLKRIDGRILYGIPVCAFMLALSYLLHIPVKDDAGGLLFCMYGGLLPAEGANIFLTLLFCFPFLMQMILFGDALPHDLRFSSVFIFTRTGKRTKWLLERYAEIELGSLLYYCAQFLTVLLAALALGFRFDWGNIAVALFYFLFSLILMNNLWLLIANTLSMKNMGHIYCAVILMLFFASIFFISSFEKFDFLLKLNPIPRSAVVLYAFPERSGYSGTGAYSLAGTLAWGLTGRAALSLIGAKWLNQTDIL